MPIPLVPILSAIASLGGAYLSYKGQKDTNAANAQQAQKAMDFEERMSNTSYQRGKADILAAGYNPALAYNKGGAETPTGRTAEMRSELAAFGGSAAAAAETFNSIARTQADVQRTQAETKLTQAQATQLNLESAARAQTASATAALTGSNARFAEETFRSRADLASGQAFGQSIKNQQGRLDLAYTGDVYQRNKDVLWPLAVEQLRQDLAHSTATTRDVQARAQLNELSIPTARNIAAMAETTWGKKISPFLSDANTLARMLSIGRR